MAEIIMDPNLLTVAIVALFTCGMYHVIKTLIPRIEGHLPNIDQVAPSCMLVNDHDHIVLHPIFKIVFQVIGTLIISVCTLVFWSWMRTEPQDGVNFDVDNSRDDFSEFSNDQSFPFGFCIKCSRNEGSAVNKLRECKLLDVLQTTEIVNHTDLAVDGESKVCPITTEDDLYPFVSKMMESEESIFEQLTHFDDESLMIFDPPKWDELTKEQQDEYSMNGLIDVEPWYLKDVQNGGQWAANWTEQAMDEWIARTLEGNFKGGTYGPWPGTQLWRMLDSGKYDEFFKGRAMVMGSQVPWIEVILLAKGMDHVTTAEYGTINAAHPKMSWIHPADLNAAGDSGMNKYDVIVSYSSSEHSGLGRYGDPLNPSGDLQSLAQMSCLLKPGGLLFFAAPTNIGHEAVQFNAGRIYGEKRLRLMFMQYRVVGTSDNPIQVGFTKSRYDYQPWFVLQNKRGCA